VIAGGRSLNETAAKASREKFRDCPRTRYARPVHASIWKFAGDPDDLLARYDAMVAEIPPGNLALHLCLRAGDGIVLVDTCPSAEVFRTFVAGEAFAALRARHGLPQPEALDDYPVHRAFVDGRQQR
jgi:hypothetical protein